LAALGVLYGVAAEIGRGRLPRRIWVGAHYVEGVELLPTYASLAEEGTFLVESGIIAGSIAASTARVLAGFVLGSIGGVLLGVATGRAARLEYVT
jgi:ABC-type nitrate/sulfonate/bicarbonate transport system permease component